MSGGNNDDLEGPPPDTEDASCVDSFDRKDLSLTDKVSDAFSATSNLDEIFEDFPCKRFDDDFGELGNSPNGETFAATSNTESCNTIEFDNTSEDSLFKDFNSSIKVS